MKQREIKKCAACDREFEVTRDRKTYCSRKCSSSTHMKKYLSDPLVKERNSKQLKAYNSSDIGRENAKKKYNNPEFTDKLLNGIKEFWNSDVGQFRKKSLIEFVRSEDGKLKNSLANAIKWSDPIYAENRAKKQYRFKEYVMPSGEVYFVQGYEPFALDELLLQHDENQIVLGFDIIKELGKFEYIINDRRKTYIPDIFVRSTNKIIEVKSNWTYNTSIDVLPFKRQSVENKGYLFEIWIVSPNKKTIII